MRICFGKFDSGSPEAGDRATILYTLLISARHHGQDPEAYLRDLIEQLPTCESDEASLRQLLPENWTAPPRGHQEIEFTGATRVAEAA